MNGTPFVLALALSLLAALPAAGQSVLTAAPDPNHPILSQAFQDRTDQETGFPLTAGNTFELFEYGVVAFPRKLDLVRTAQRTLFVTTMIAARDTTGTAFADALIAAAARGVDVRFVADAQRTRPRYFERLEAGGVQVIRYNRLFTIGDRAHRIHQKMVVADFRRAITGGMNMADAYNQGDGVNDDYKDTDVYAEGDVAAETARHFLQLWLALRPGDASAQAHLSGYPSWGGQIPLPAPLGSGGQVGLGRFVNQESDLGDRRLRETYVRSIAAARRQVVWHVNNLYPSDGPLLDGLKDAAARGVRVVLLTNSLQACMRRVGAVFGWFQYQFLRAVRAWRLRSSGIEVWESDVPLHSKALTIDGVMASIGSYNLSAHSDDNMECATIVYDPQLVRDVELMFERDLRMATRAQ